MGEEEITEQCASSPFASLQKQCVQSIEESELDFVCVRKSLRVFKLDVSKVSHNDPLIEETMDFYPIPIPKAIQAPSPELIRPSSPMEDIIKPNKCPVSILKCPGIVTIKPKKSKETSKVHDRFIFRAVQENDDLRVRELLEEGADPNTTCDIGTILHMACQLGFTKVVEVIQKRGNISASWLFHIWPISHYDY